MRALFRSVIRRARCRGRALRWHRRPVGSQNPLRGCLMRWKPEVVRCPLRVKMPFQRRCPTIGPGRRRIGPARRSRCAELSGSLGDPRASSRDASSVRCAPLRNHPAGLPTIRARAACEPRSQGKEPTPGSTPARRPVCGPRSRTRRARPPTQPRQLRRREVARSEAAASDVPRRRRAVGEALRARFAERTTLRPKNRLRSARQSVRLLTTREGPVRRADRASPVAAGRRCRRVRCRLRFGVRLDPRRLQTFSPTSTLMRPLRALLYP
jgi:hypothetical protein